MKKAPPFLRCIPLLTLLCLLAAGCAVKEPPQAARPGLLEDAGFLADLRNSGTKGLRGITIVAPSSGPEEEGRDRAYAMARMLGVNFPEHALDDKVPYNANTDQARLEFLSEALADPDTEVIWALRGGYGSSRLLEGLSRIPPGRTKKVLIGYSDTTFLHLFFQKNGWRTIHGGLFGEIGNPGKDENNFRQLAALLSGRVRELHYDGLVPYNEEALRQSRPVRAVLVGGNLTCIAAAAGTPWALDASGKILFLEDVKEPGYKIDRMLTQLRQAGLFKDVKAILFGSFTQGDKFTDYALERFAADCGIPVFKTGLFGHGPRNYPLVFNAPAMLAKSPDTGNAFSLRIRAGSLP